MNQSELGSRIKQCRKAQNFTQEKLAELIDVTPHYIYEIEKGLKTMSVPILIDIASILNVSVDYLLFGTPAAPPCQPPPALSCDRLHLLLQDMSPRQRDNLANVINALLPYLK
ncbi:MAG: helix-turn-helix domain-containing protein [Lachnospiraceae bacterium]|nr:helix-turn-helix domain-containing protein [Lachnospiraceae bacterium]MDE7029051.1 helix-turn-helix domain-containing protein [Lachnospiraceae bacterium]